jgi:hypothetical protein
MTLHSCFWVDWVARSYMYTCCDLFFYDMFFRSRALFGV